MELCMHLENTGWRRHFFCSTHSFCQSQAASLTKKTMLFQKFTSTPLWTILIEASFLQSYTLVLRKRETLHFEEENNTIWRKSWRSSVILHRGGFPHKRSGDAVNWGFWTQLGCFVQNAIIFSRNGLFSACTKQILKRYIFSIRFIYSIHVRGKKKVGPCPFRGSIQHSWGASPPVSYGSVPWEFYILVSNTLSPTQKRNKQTNKQAKKQIVESHYILRNIDFSKEIGIKCNSVGLRIRTFCCWY